MANHKQSYQLTSRLLRAALFFVIAYGTTGLFNTLQAADRNVDYQTTVANWDSLFRTVLDPLESPGKGMGWKPYNRWLWFYSQRVDGLDQGVNPMQLRMQAWEEKQASRRPRSPLDESWTSIGPANFAGRMLCIVYNPSNTNIIYAGSASGGLWKTTDAGSSWTCMTDDLPSLAVGSIALDPADPDIVYIGTGEGSFNIDAVYGAGIFKSTDGGATWNTTGLSWTQSQGTAVNEIVIDPNNTQILYAATNSSGNGVYKSTNGGASWTRYHFGDVKDIEMHPDSSTVLYCAVGLPWGGSSNGIYKSINSGVTWTLLSNGMPSGSNMGRIELDISESDPNILYAGVSQTIYAGSGLYGIYKSSDGGASWTQQAASPNMYSGQGWYNLVVAVDPTDPSILFSNGLDSYKSTNSGVSWTRKSYWSYPDGHSLYAHADHHALAFKPGNPNEILLGTDGGIFKSTNGGDTWTSLNNGIVTFQFYAMCNDALQPSVAFGGTQDNGTNMFTGSSTWERVYGGDGGYCNVNPTNSNYVYATTQRGYHRRSTNGGSSFTTIMNGIGETGAWVTPRVIDPSNHSTLYTGTTKVYKTINNGDLWTAISGNLYSTYISTIAVAPSDPNTIIIGYEGGGRVFKTTNGGSTWTAIYSGLPYRYVTRVAIDPNNADHFWVTVSGYSGGHVWESTDEGSSWTNRSTGLPDIPVNVVVIDQDTPDNMYVGTDLGVYTSTDGGLNWQDFSGGLPNVVVDDLALHPTSGMLRAGTHGRGMWETSSGVATLSVISPNGGEEWMTGDSENIGWSTGALGGNVKIELNRNYPSGGWETITASTVNDGNYSWSVSGAVSANARAKITWLTDTGVNDESNSDFSIIDPGIFLTAPLGGETWTIGSIRTIDWNLLGISGTVQVYIDRNYPSGNWEYLGLSAVGSFYWTVSAPSTSNARIKVQLSSNPSYADTSGTLTIDGPWFEVVQPNGAESLTPGSTYIVRWNAYSFSGTVDVQLNRSYPGGAWVTLATDVGADSLVWIVDQNGTTSARIRVVSSTEPAVYDDSDGNFTVLTPALIMVTPNGGESWLTGNSEAVSWTKNNLQGSVNLSINRDYPGGAWDLIAINESGTSYDWTVSAPFTTAARIRVESVNIPGYNDASNANFTIADGEPGVRITSPNGGETWETGTQQSITWTRNLADGPLTVQLNRNYPAGAWETISASNSGVSQLWTVGGSASANVRVRVYLNSNPSLIDYSDANFTITNPVLTLTYPNGGEEWIMEDIETITWTRTDAPGNVSVQLMRSYPGGNWETITTNNNVSGQSWTVSGTPSANARIRVYLTANPVVGDTSAANFALIVPGITLLSPNGGETWEAGATETISWTRSAAVGGVNILINRDYPGGAWETLFENEQESSVQWLVNGPATETARIRLYLVSNPSIADTGNNDFTITNPDLAVTSPNGGEEWLLGEQQAVTFNRSNAEGPVTVQYMTGYPSGSWLTISADVAGSSVNWTPAGSPDPAVRVRAFLNSDPAIADTSNANFALVVPGLTVVLPNGGEDLIVGEQVQIAWDRFHADGAVTVSIDRNFAVSSWEVIDDNVTGSALNWIVEGPETENARIKVSLNGDPAVFDESDANFAVVQPRLTLESPNGGEEITLGADMTVRWSRTAAPGNVSVRLNRNYPAGGWESLTTTASADSFVWNSGGASSDECRVKITLTADPAVGDTSANNFAIIARSVELASHHGGAVYTNSISEILLNRTAAPGDVTLELNREYPSGSWETLTTTEISDSYNWNVSGPVTGNARLRVIYNSAPFIGDTSASSFLIEEAGIVLHAPDGGELWAVGAEHNISWSRYGFSDAVKVELNRDYPNGAWELLIDSVAGDEWLWSVTAPATESARVRVTSINDGAVNVVSQEGFEIAEPQLTITSPAGGSQMKIGFTYEIELNRFLADGDARVELNRDYPSGNWEILGTTPDSSLAWIPDLPESGSARLRIYLLSDNSVGDTLDTDLSIFLPSLTLTSPVGGEEIRQTTDHVVTWLRDGLSGGVRVELKTDYPNGNWTTLDSGITSNSCIWTVSQEPADNVRIRVVYEDIETFADSSAANFRIFRPELSVISPVGGETFIIGQSYQIEFSKIDHDGSVRVLLNREYPTGNWETILTGITGTSANWSATGPETENARVRVESEIYPGIYGTGANIFEILEPGIRLNRPVGGEAFAVGSQQWLSWRRVAVGNVDVLLNRDYPAGNWESLLTNGNADSVIWTVTLPASENCRLKVREHSNPSVYDQSDWDFQIMNAAIAITAPAPGDTFAIGLPNQIAWDRNAAALGEVRIDLDRNYPSGTWETIGQTDGSALSWNATLPQTANARLRAVFLPQSAVGDTLEFDLAIDYASLTILEPSASGNYLVGETLSLVWNREKVGSGVDIFLNRDYPSSNWEQLAANVSTDNYDWQVAAPRATDARIRILSVHNAALGDTTPALTILDPEIELTAPNSGTFGAGNTTTISWNRTDFSGPVSLEVNYDYPGGAWISIAAALSGSDYLWTVGSTLTSSARIRVSSDEHDAGDISDNDITIVQPVITVTSLNSPEAFEIGEQVPVTWTKIAVPGSVNVELNRDFPDGDWELLAENISGTNFLWTISGSEFVNGRVRVSMQTRPGIYDISNANIGTYLPDLLLQIPNGGDTLIIGESTTIRWVRNDAVGSARVKLNRDYPNGDWAQLGAITGSDSIVWTPDGSETTNARVKVELVFNQSVYDVSDENFAILNQSIELLSPVAGDSIAVGDTVHFVWQRVGVPAGINVYLKRNYPSGQWELLAEGITSDTWNWLSGGSAAPNAHFRVLYQFDAGLYDIVGPVNLGTPQLTVTSPSEPAVFLVGGEAEIEWARSFAEGQVQVELSRNGVNGPWENLGVSEGNSFAWTVTLPETGEARFRVKLVSKSWVAGATAFNNEITTPSLTLTAPQPGQQVAIGRELIIAWNRYYVDDPVDVYLDRDSPILSEELLRENVSGDSIHWIATGPPAANTRFILRTASGIDVYTDSGGDGILLADPVLTLTAPLGGEDFVAGETMTVEWIREINEDPVRVELNRDYPDGQWELLAGELPADSFEWTVTGPSTENARIQITSTVDENLIDRSESDLTLIVPALAFTSLSENDRLPLGFETSIEWTRTAVDDPLHLYLSRDGGNSYPEQIASSLIGTDVAWTPSGESSETAKLKLVSASDPELFTESPVFAIPQPWLSLENPAGGEELPIGDESLIHFTSTDHPAPVNILLNRDYPGGNWESLAENISVDSLLWTVSGPPSDAARIRVVSTVDEEWYAESASDFTLIQPSLLILSPSAGSELIVGDSLTVAFERVAWSGPVEILLNREGGESSLLASGAEGDEVIAAVPAPEAGLSWVVVRDEINPARADSIQVNGPFVPALTLISPDDGERWIEGEQQILRWSRFHAGGEVNVYINTDTLINSEELLGVTAADSIAYTPEGFESDHLAVRIEHVERAGLETSASEIRVVIPSLTLLEPHSGSYRTGTTLAASWSNHEADGPVRLELKRDYPAGEWEIIYTGGETDFDWTVSGDTTRTARFRVVSDLYPQAADTSAENIRFYIPALRLTVLADDTLFIGDEVELQIEFSGEEALCNIELRREPGGEWEELFTGIGAGGVTWTATGEPAAAARFRAFVPGDEDLEDVSGEFSILNRELRLDTELPEELIAGELRTIEWTPIGVGGPFDLLLLRENLDPETLAASSAETAYDWTVAGPRSESAQLVISGLSEESYTDSSSIFAIRVPELLWSLPAESGVDTAGQTLELAWERIDFEGFVDLEVNFDSLNGEWTSVVDSLSEISYTYPIPGRETDSLRFRATSVDNPELSAMSPVRSIVSPGLQLSSPGGTLYIGQQVWIYWDRNHAPGDVNLEVNYGDRAGEWEQIAVSAIDSALWTVAGPASDFAALRLSLVANSAIFDTTDEAFRIVQPYVTITEPNGGEVLDVEDEIRIRWSGEGFDGGVSIGLWRDEPVNRLDTLFFDIENDFEEIWQVTGPAADSCWLVMISNEYPELMDTSDAAFTILGGTATDEPSSSLPTEYALSAPYPNPFNNESIIEYALPTSGEVALRIYNVMGQRVATLVEGFEEAGYRKTHWNAQDVATGIYFLRMTAGDFARVRKLQLIR